MTNSIVKGKIGELELAKALTELGHPARRGCQFAGRDQDGNSFPDIHCPTLSRFHFECKRIGRGSATLYKWLDQAAADAEGSQIPVVIQRPNHKPWSVTMFLPDFITIVDGGSTNKHTN